MLYLVEQKHPPNLCSGVNDDVAKIFVDAWNQRDKSLQEFGVKLVGNYANPPEHKLYLVLESKDIESVQDVVMKMCLSKWGNVLTKPVMSFDETIKKVVKM